MKFFLIISECSLPLRLGDCGGSVTRYYYNSATGKCQSFQYTGCGGNLNNFEHEDECNFRCVCSRPRGSGQGSARITRYFYNKDTKSCEPFSYRGTGGNSNRFLSAVECEGICDPVGKKCKARPEFGKSCENTTNSIRFYYDINSDVCRPFRLQGCQGSRNTFKTETKCLQTCSMGAPIPPTPQPEFCQYQAVAGPCDGNILRYYYDTELGVCQTFNYSGCGGNSNNFVSKRQCKKTCLNTDVTDGDGSVENRTPKPVTTTTAASKMSPVVCNYEPSTGNCGFRFRRYYFDKATGTCKAFVYSGCGGNLNRFVSLEGCLLTCSVSKDLQ